MAKAPVLTPPSEDFPRWFHDIVAKAELAEGLAGLLAQLLQGVHPLARRGTTALRKEIRYALKESPSLAPKLQDPRWLDVVWASAIAQAVNETGLTGFPESCPWMIQDEVLNLTWWPTSGSS